MLRVWMIGLRFAHGFTPFTNIRFHEFVTLSAPGRRKALRLYDVFYSLRLHEKSISVR